jgi:hypothetical protein
VKHPVEKGVSITICMTRDKTREIILRAETFSGKRQDRIKARLFVKDSCKDHED